MDPVVDAVYEPIEQSLILNNIISGFPDDAIIIAIMEECSVRLWFSQIYSNRKYFVSLHTAESFYMPMLHENKNRLDVENRMLKNTCRSSLKIVFLSRGCCADLCRYYSLEHDLIKTIGDPVNIDRINLLKSIITTINFDDYAGKTIFVNVARLDDTKNNKLLIRACKILTYRFKDFVMLCIGGGLYDEIRHQVEDENMNEYIFLLGEISNPFPVMAKSKSLVLTSQFESLALVLVEAMVCGSVPISVDCPYGQRNVLEDGKYGMFVPADDVDELAEVMYKILTDTELYNSYLSVLNQGASRYDLGKALIEWEDLFCS